jgi:hypothetical protein
MQLATVAQELPPRLVDHERTESPHTRRLLRVLLAFSMRFLGTPILTLGNLSRSHELMAFQEYVYSPC